MGHKLTIGDVIKFENDSEDIAYTVTNLYPYEEYHLRLDYIKSGKYFSIVFGTIDAMEGAIDDGKVIVVEKGFYLINKKIPPKLSFC